MFYFRSNQQFSKMDVPIQYVTWTLRQSEELGLKSIVTLDEWKDFVGKPQPREKTNLWEGAVPTL
jgi:hypothetical protein